MTLFTRQQKEEDFTKLWESIYELEGVIIFDASLFPSFILIDNINISIKHRQKGLGTQIINEVCQYADKYSLDVLLLPDAGFGTPLEVLRYFYNKFGFKESENSVYVQKGYESYLLRNFVNKEQSITFELPNTK